MAKLTRRQREELERALKKMDRGARFLRGSDIIISRRYDREGEDGVVVPLVKDTELDLQVLFSGIEYLREFLEKNP